MAETGDGRGHEVQDALLAMAGPILAVKIVSLSENVKSIVYSEHGWIFAIRFHENSEPAVLKHPSEKSRSVGLQVFASKMVHGIEVRQANSTDNLAKTAMCAYGDNSLRLVNVKFHSCSSSLALSCSAKPYSLNDDLIVAAKFISADRLAVVTANNRLLQFSADLDVLSITYDIGQSMLTAAYIYEFCWSWTRTEFSSDLMLFAGTCFGDIKARVCVEAVSTYDVGDHAGVVYSIDYHAERNLLASTSDDRSCRLYSVSIKPYPTETPYKISLTFQLLFTLFGHEARVWKCRITSKFVITVGEDSRSYLWNDKGTLVEEWTAHPGCSVWSLDVSERDGKCDVATGGGDSAVVYRNLDHTFPVQNLPEVQLVKSNTPSQKRVRQVAIVDHTRLLAVLQDGYLYLIDTTKNVPEWKLVLQDDMLAKCVRVLPVPDLPRIVILTCTGRLTEIDLLPQPESCFNLNLGSPSMDLQIVRDGATDRSKPTYIISGPSGLIMFVTRQPGGLVLTGTVGQNCSSSWITSAAVRGDFIVCGDRGGSLHCVRVIEGCEPHVDELHVEYRVHGAKEVSQISFFECCLVTSGRDGRVIFWKIVDEGDNCTLHRIRVLQISRSVLEWIGGFVLHVAADSTTPTVLAYGFLAKSMTVVNMNSLEKIAEVECGGGNRSYALYPSSDGHIVRFAYTKKESIVWADLPVLLSRKFLSYPKSVFQGDRIWSIGYMGQEADSRGCVKFVFVTGSDDTLVRLIAVRDPITASAVPTSPDLVVTCKGHLSSVRAVMASCARKNCLYSAGGRGQLLRWEAVDGILGDYLVGADYAPFPVVRKKWSDDSLLDPDIRIMCLSVCVHDGQEFVASGKSDGGIDIFLSTFSPDSLHLFASTAPAVDCQLQLKFVSFAKNLAVVSGGTSGDVRITYVDLSKTTLLNKERMKLALATKCHQSGVNAMDVNREEDDLRIATGGDDDAITILKFSDAECSRHDRFGIASAHNAQITGIAFLSASRLVSAGKDQLIKVWYIDYNSKQMFTERVIYSAVADVTAICTISENTENDVYIALVGASFELRKLMRE